MDLQTAQRVLTHLDVGFTVTGGTFDTLNPNFSANDWFQLVSNTGDFYVGSCCPLMSNVQDVLCKWCRFKSTAIPAAELAYVALLANYHGDKWFDTHPWEAVLLGMSVKDWDEFSRIPNIREVVQEKGLWEFLGVVWQVVKGFSPAPTTFNDLDRVPHKLSDALFALRHAGVFLSSHIESPGTLRGEIRFEFEKAQYANRLIGAIPRIVSHLSQLDASAIHGFAIVDKTSSRVLKELHGFHVYDTRGLAEAAQQEHHIDDGTTRIRALRISPTIPGGYAFTEP